MDSIPLLLKKAQKFLRSAAVLYELEDFDSSASRAYFAMFFAAQAVLLHDTGDLSSKQGIRSAFRERFVDSGRLPDRAADAFDQGYELQEVGDYGHQFAVSNEDATWLLQEAEAFVYSMERLVERTTA